MNPRLMSLCTVVVVLWASAFVGIQALMKVMSPGSFALYRLVLSSITLWIISRAMKMKSMARKDLLHVMFSGVTGSTAYVLFINMAQPYVTSAESCVVINTVPVFTTLGGWLFLKQKVGLRAILGMAVSFSGIVFIALGKGDLTMGVGMVFLVLASLSMATSTVMQKHLLKTYSPLQVISTGLWFGTLFAFPFGTSLFSEWKSFSLDTHLLVLYLAVFPSAVAYLAWGNILRTMSTHQASSLLYMVPVVTAGMGYAFLGEGLTFSLVAGGMLAVGGVALIQLRIGPPKIIPFRPGEKAA